MAKNQTDLFHSTVPLPHQALTDEQRIDWLRLWRSVGIGAITFRDLLNHFGSARGAIENIDNRQFGKRRFRIADKAEALREIEITHKFGANLVALGEAGYPRWLQSIEGAPPLIYVKGLASLSRQPAIAIVGSRNASGAGLKIAEQLAFELGQLGLAVCSGLARGIDARAHHAAIKSGTIAVLGGGIDHIYPAQNEALYHQIAERGLLISEQPMGYVAKANDFPRRNRLISGLSLGTIVVEAAVRSGSLGTARYSGEQGRLVFAVPGHPLDPRAKGTNRLIQDGASLVTEAQDVFSALKPQLDHADCTVVQECEQDADDGLLHNFAVEKNQNMGEKADCIVGGGGQDQAVARELRDQLLNLLGPAPLDRDSLVRLLGCKAKDLQILLLELDLEGRIERHGHQLVSLK